MSPKQKLNAQSVHSQSGVAKPSSGSRANAWLGSGPTFLTILRRIARSLLASGDGFVAVSGNALLAPGEIELATQNVHRLLQ